jgi:hypothetical protein
MRPDIQPVFLEIRLNFVLRFFRCKTMSQTVTPNRYIAPSAASAKDHFVADDCTMSAPMARWNRARAAS